MKVNTRLFGEISVEENNIVRFSQVIPGFENLYQFVIIQPDEQIPFSYLQCLDDGDVSFIVTDPFLAYPDYDFVLTNEVLESLSIKSEHDIMIRSIVNFTQTEPTINLLAPLVININSKLGKQIILHDSNYTVRHKLAPNVNQEKTGSAGDR